MSRSADLTRQDLLEAATTVFAAQGYDGASVREIAARAEANQAAISYHFGGKEGLYREVLKRAVAAFDLGGLDAEKVAAMDRAEAVHAFLDSQLSTLLRHDEVGKALRIFAWENVARTDAFRAFVATERLPAMEVGAAIVRRYLPAADPELLMTTILWLVHQAEPFVHNRDRLKDAPMRLTPDRAFLRRLSDRLTILVVAGLEALERAETTSAAPSGTDPLRPHSRRASRSGRSASLPSA